MRKLSIEINIEQLSQQLAIAYKAACMQELQAIKPGNVHIFADGHGMALQDFIASAEASASVISQPDLSLGQRILQSVRATHQVAGCNTNLGIILLCAPLIQACFMAVKSNAYLSVNSDQFFLHAPVLNDALKDILKDNLKHALKTCLNNTTLQDAQNTFLAIKLASPAGLGQSTQHDVNQPATANLLAAMQFAANRDLIALQYSNNFADIFHVCINAYQQAFGLFNNTAWSTTALYLTLLAQFKDSHIIRKHGEQSALIVQQAANVHLTQLLSMQNPKLYLKTLLSWDTQLKIQGINPGTCADMTVASLMLLHIFAIKSS